MASSGTLHRVALVSVREWRVVGRLTLRRVVGDGLARGREIIVSAGGVKDMFV
jgi:hypothetical protein